MDRVDHGFDEITTTDSRTRIFCDPNSPGLLFPIRWAHCCGLKENRSREVVHQQKLNSTAKSTCTCFQLQRDGPNVRFI